MVSCISRYFETWVWKKGLGEINELLPTARWNCKANWNEDIPVVKCARFARHTLHSHFFVKESLAQSCFVGKHDQSSKNQEPNANRFGIDGLVKLRSIRACVFLCYAVWVSYPSDIVCRLQESPLPSRSVAIGTLFQPKGSKASTLCQQPKAAMNLRFATYSTGLKT